MRERKLIEAVAVVVCAIVGGALVGQYYAGSFTGVAKAENTAPFLPDSDPDWKDLTVVYLVSADRLVSNEIY